MQVLTRVVDLGSIHLAAKQLGMSAAAVTRSVGMLEAHLNMRTLNRTTRGLPPAEIGKDHLDGCREIIGKLDEMESNLMRAARDLSGTLRMVAPMAFLTSGLGALLASFRTLHPRIDFDVTTFDTHVDMGEGGYDVCFSDDRRLAGATLVSSRLANVDEMVVASPVYLPRHGTPRQISILYAGCNNLSRKVRSFIDFTVSQYRAPDKTMPLCAAA
jgi:DNA-binding transcriptional LysR family regulator